MRTLQPPPATLPKASAQLLHSFEAQLADRSYLFAPVRASGRIAVSTTEAGKLLGCSRWTVLRLVQSGQVVGTRNGTGRVYVSVRSLEAFVERGGNT